MVLYDKITFNLNLAFQKWCLKKFVFIKATLFVTFYELINYGALKINKILIEKASRKVRLTSFMN